MADELLSVGADDGELLAAHLQLADQRRQVLVSGVDVIVRLATIGSDGFTGTFSGRA